ncbi:hypothetical protein G6F22_021252 [Rhizopus arrhizus]|nr:hypothetical protein G6F22_021252 [Rhizopus arrhizus]
MVPIRHVQHVHAPAEDAQPPLGQRGQQVATCDVVVHHVVRHHAHPQAGADRVAQEGVVAGDHGGFQHHVLARLAAIIGRQPQRPADDGRADDGRARQVFGALRQAAGVGKGLGRARHVAHLAQFARH